MIGIIFCPSTSIAVLIVENSFFRLDFNLHLPFRLSSRRHRFHSGRETTGP